MQNEAYYLDLKMRLEVAEHGKRSDLIKSAANYLGKSEMTIWRNVKKLGYGGERKSRSDKGKIEITLGELKQIAAHIYISHRANKKKLASVRHAIEVLYANGKIKREYHPATIARLLRERGLSTKQMRRAKPHVGLRSAHPNHFWQVDPSFCVLYYLKGGKKMKIMDEAEFYKNKPQNFEKIAKDRVLRYVCVDHFSGAFFCYYYNAPGESQELMFDFLVRAMSVKDKQLNPFEGVPQVLGWDKGSANSAMIKRFLDQLGVKHTAHVKGNSRAKGSVEKTNDIIETNFESRLMTETITSIEQLNEMCEHWQRNFQSTRKHSRTQMTRFGGWRTIKPEQLIACPPREICQALLTTKPETRDVQGDYRIPYDGKKYSVSEVDNIAIGDTVQVAINPFAYPNIRVTHPNRFGEMVTYDIAPLELTDGNFPIENRLVDGETFRKAKESYIDKNRKDLGEMAYGTRDEQEIDKLRNSKSAPAFGGEIDSMSYLAEQNEANAQLRIPKKGSVLDVNAPEVQKVEKPKAPGFDSVKRDEAVLPVLDFIKWFVKQHGVIDGMADRIRAEYADGLRESEYQQTADRLLGKTTPKMVVAL